MSTNTSPQPDTGSGPSRPSLFGSPPPAGAPAAPLSVLSALEGPAPRAPGARRRAFPWIGALAVVLVAGATAWMLRSPHAGPDAAPVQVAAAAVTAPQSAAPPVSERAEVIGAAASAAMAAIEELPASAVVPAPPVVAAAPVASSAAKAKPREKVEKADKAEKDKRTQVARAEPRPRPAPKPESRAAAPAAAAASAATPGSDADVDLIAALVQHLSRDTRGTELGIADLVARCKSLQGSEALRCQRRICENYWGRADACPRSQAPNEVAARP